MTAAEHTSRRMNPFRREFIPVFGFLVLSLIATTFAWAFEQRRVNAINALLFEQASDAFYNDTIEMMERHVHALRAAAAMVDVSKEVTREEWAYYVADLGLGETYPGMFGMSLNLLFYGVEAKEKFETVERLRGAPNFQITPAGTRDVYLPVVYLEPLTEANSRAIGYDIYSEPVRREAIDRALESNRAEMTGKIVLVQDSEGPTPTSQSAVLLIHPLHGGYRAKTGQKISDYAEGAFVVAAFRMGDLMASVSARQSKDVAGGLSIRLYDAAAPSEDALLYASFDEVSAPYKYSKTFPLYGRTWTLQTTAPQFFSAATATPSPLIVAISGLLLSLMLTAIMWVLTLRAQESRIATAAAQENNRHVKTLMHEVNHRSKNLLTVVHAISRLTAGSDPERFQKHFSQRIEALSASQDLLVRSAWKGTQFSDLVASQLAHYKDLIGTRIFASGPEIQLHAAAAQTIGMAIHELSTNAGWLSRRKAKGLGPL